MGADPETSVVGPTGEAHHLPGLFLADSSVFPTSLGVNPQLTTMTLATAIGRAVGAG
jgi:choline dehydrogenase-like flavoprotein